MFKTTLTAILALTLALFLVPALAGEEMDKKAEVTKDTPSTTQAENPVPEGEVSVMDQPVDFSTPEAVEESIDRVRQEAGEDEARHLKNALGYILAYDLSLGRDKEKMYKKLNGRTPNAIIAKMKR
ncbi:MAG: hypothetical protein HKP21_12650 [Xanthomonadales bacterium]|nr:hypothetical protein [Gammaproteobacteria bacterium]MBT8076862.1 hypothetical protein [Gammaproteobacteria bacterium]NNK05397.1 hypothetical protein [Xanthomonadales bacterium]NNK97857.1 hypothetical protein [Xanthomonadales bacterium]